jgi:hypothetical protein
MFFRSCTSLELGMEEFLVHSFPRDFLSLPPAVSTVDTKYGENVGDKIDV